MSSAPLSQPDPRVRTFHARRGRLGPELSDALDRLLPVYAVPGDQPLDPRTLFAPLLPVALEIGCGMGDATIAMAQAEPAVGIIATDVHTRGIAALARGLDQGAITNVRILHGDAIALLERLEPESLNEIRAWFPDPWPKARHHKRRLVQPAAVELMASRLSPGARLRLATDWSEYADHMLEVLDAQPLLRNRHSGFADRAVDRPVTRYEGIALRAGRPIHDLEFERA